MGAIALLAGVEGTLTVPGCARRHREVVGWMAMVMVMATAGIGDVVNGG